MSGKLGPQDPRYRRDLRRARQFQFPLREDPKTSTIQYLISSKGALAVDPELGAYVRVASPLVVQASSPYAIALSLAENMEVTDEGLAHKPVSMADIANSSTVEGADLAAVIERLQENKIGEGEVSTTPTPDFVPRALGTGLLDPGWIAAAAPAAHATTHEQLGSDEIDVTGLQGLLADPQTPLPEVLALADLTDVTAKAGSGTVVVMDDSPLIHTPQLDAPDISGGSIDAATITGLGAPTLGGDAANKTYVDAGDATKQPLDADLTTIAGLTATTDNFMQAKSSAWASRTVAQVKTDLGLTGTNSGDQTITLTGDVTGTGAGSFAATVVSATSPKITTSILDSAGNKLFGLTATASAVNYWDIQNQAATGGPRMTANGTDTDIDAIIGTKGAGLVKARYSSTSYEIETVKTYAAKGDLIAGTANDARAVLPVGANGTSLQAASGETTGLKWVQPVYEFTISGLASAGLTWSDLPAAVGFLASSTRHILKRDLTTYTQARLVLYKAATAGSSGSKVGLYFKSTYSATAADYAILGTSAIEVAVNTTDTPIESSWIDLASGAKADVYIACLGYGGDGSTDPTFGEIALQVR